MFRITHRCICIKIDLKNDILYSVQATPCISDNNEKYNSKNYNSQHPLQCVSQHTIHATNLKSFETKPIYTSFESDEFDDPDLFELDEEELFDFRAIKDICVVLDGRKLYVLRTDSLQSINIQAPRDEDDVIDFDEERIILNHGEGEKNYTKSIEVDKFERFAVMTCNSVQELFDDTGYIFKHTTWIYRINIKDRRVQNIIVLRDMSSESLTLKPTSFRSDQTIAFLCTREGIFEIEFGDNHQQSTKRLIEIDELEFLHKGYNAFDIPIICDKTGTVWSCWKAKGIQVILPQSKILRSNVMCGNGEYDTITSIAIDRRGVMYFVEQTGFTKIPDRIHKVDLDDDSVAPVPLLWKRVYDILRFSRFFSACTRLRRRTTFHLIIETIASIDGKLSAEERSIIIKFGSDKTTLGMPLRLRTTSITSPSPSPSKRRRIETTSH